ncbi:MAG TPA: hypothetical protein VFZ84_17035 [Burkholderiales bacterium]
MQQLIDQVTQRTGIPEDKARTAVDTVVGYLKEHLPGPVASQRPVRGAALQTAA